MNEVGLFNAGGLGSPENPWPSWALLNGTDIREACLKMGETEDHFLTVLLPILTGIVRDVEVILRNVEGREDTKNFFAENILRISKGNIFLMAFTCVNGNCCVEAEWKLASGVGKAINLFDWKNMHWEFPDE